MTTEPQTAEQLLYQQVEHTPTEAQAAIHESWKETLLVTGGEQAGKSVLTSKEFLKRWPYDLEEKYDGEEPLLYWLVGADYNAVKKEFDYIATDFYKIFGLANVEVSKRLDPGHISFWPVNDDGTRPLKPTIIIETKSAKEEAKLRADAPNGIMMCEAGACSYETYERCFARSRYSDGWLLMTGTLEDSQPWYGQLAQAWYLSDEPDREAFRLDTGSNTYLFPDGWDDPNLRSVMSNNSDRYITQRLKGVPVPPKGLVFGQDFSVATHVTTNAAYARGQRVWLAVDPGYAGAYAVMACHIFNDQLIVFDEVYEQNLVTSQIIDICKQKDWWPDVHPHAGAIDVAAKQHQALSPVAEVWADSETGKTFTAEHVDIHPGTERLRSFLKPHPLTRQPKIVFNPGCKGVLSEFGVTVNPFDNVIRPYRWQQASDGSLVSPTPIDKYNHAIKALTYLIVAKFGYASPVSSKVKVTRWRKRRSKHPSLVGEKVRL